MLKGGVKMRIGTSNSTKILDSACVNEYKIPLIVMMENAVLSAFKHMDIENNRACKTVDCSWKRGRSIYCR